MSGNQLTLGQAIDQILLALGPLDDGARRTALIAACMQLGIALSEFPGLGAKAEAKKAPATEGQPVASAPPAPTVQAPRIDIRTFREQKKPASARQMACLVGFYLQELAPEGERKETITTPDLEKYFKQAGFRLPADIGQILKDAKAAGYFDAPARGEYKLNAVGYNLVAHNLPNISE